MGHTEADVAKGAAVYSRAALMAYDAFVLGFSNSLAWKCPSRVLVEFYNQNVSADHLDIGVGTGYFLDRCKIPVASPRLTLVDLNPNCLRVTEKRLRRHHPSYDLAGCHLANVLEPGELGEAMFSSIGVNYSGGASTRAAFHQRAWCYFGHLPFGPSINPRSWPASLCSCCKQR